MKFVIITLFTHFFLIILFTTIYYAIPLDNFETMNGKSPKNLELMDFFGLSTTIQAGVGITNVNARTDFAKGLISFQQILLIAGNIGILHYILHVESP